MLAASVSLWDPMRFRMAERLSHLKVDLECYGYKKTGGTSLKT